MTTVSQLIGEIEARGVDEYVADVRRAEAETDRAGRRIDGSMDKAGRGVEGSVGKMGSKLRDVGGRMRNVGLGLTAGVTVPAALAAGKMVMLASDAAETASKLQVTFGGATDSVVSRLDKFASATGSSRYALREQVATIGALLKPMGLASKAHEDMSVGVVQLGKDLSSFHNIAEDDALEKLRAGLTGEAEPLKQLGILMNENIVTEKAYAMGIAKRGSKLTEAQKVQARYAVILEQSKDAQGDATRTADGFANSVKKLQNNARDLGVELGNKLLPVATKLLGWAQRGIDAFGALSPRAQTMVLVGAGLAAVLGPLVVMLGMVVMSVGALMPVLAALTGPVGLVVLAIVGLVAAGVMLYKNSEQVRDKVHAAFEAIGKGVAEVLDDLQATIETWVKWATQFWRAYGEDITRFAQRAWQSIEQVIGGSLRVLQGIVQTFLAVLRGDWSSAWDGIKQIASGAWDVITGVFSLAATTLRAAAGLIWAGVRAGAVAAWDGIADTVSNWAAAVVNRAEAKLDDLRAKVIDVWNGVRDTVKGSWGFIADAVGRAASAVVTSAMESLTGENGVAARVVSVWNTVRNAVKESWGYIADNVAAAAGSVVNSALGALTGETGIAARVVGVWKAVKEGVAGTWSGISSAVKDAAAGVANAGIGALKGLIGRAGSVGSAAGRALANGLRGAVNAVIDAWNGLSFSVPKVKLPGGKSFGGQSISTPDVPRLANGGILTGATLFEGGEYAGARINPEVVAPLDRLKGMLRDAIPTPAAGTGAGATFHFNYTGAAPDPFVASRQAAFAFQTAGLAP